MRASESPRPTHGIHVNPKYLRQLEHSTLDTNIQHPRGTSALKMYGQKPAIPNDEFDPGHAEVVSSQVGAQRLISTGDAGHTPFAFGANKAHPPSTARLARPSSPSRTGPDRRFVDRASPSHPFEYGLGRVIGRDDETSGWQRKHYSDNNQKTTAVYHLGNGHEHQRPRALIDAYGNDTGKRSYNNKPLQVQRLDKNDIDSKVTPASWQNTEEEEFNWDDMSPNLGDRGTSNDFLSSAVPPFGSFRTRSGFGGQSASPLEPDNRSSWNFHMPLLASGTSPSDCEKMTPLIDKLPDADPQISGPPTITSRIGPSLDSFGVEPRPGVVPSYMGVRPPLNSINASNTVNNLGPNRSFYIPEQQMDGFGNKEPSSSKLQQLPSQHAGLIPLSQAQVTPLQPQFLPSQEVHQSAAAVLPPHFLAAPLNHGYNSRGHGATVSTGPSNPVPGVQLNILNRPLHLQGGSLPPLPPGPPPVPSQMMPLTQNAVPGVSSQQPSSAFPGLFDSLMAQGLISLNKQAQDSVGVEFNADLLKVRHESAINALYADLPRQCTTCGLRFKCQEEHRSHMDWHVTKNRMSKNRKQKPSRKWFVSVSMWLSGAEALGAEAVPGFLPTETVVEMKDDEEMAVPADEDQNACALCGEPFEEFYSDEAEEWMYKGAIYSNAPNGLTVGMDRSQLGPIVHAKCRSESSVGITAEGSQRKRMRI
ncbi:hypothetical protein ACB092_05G240600 [Castanea dentata]